MKAARFPAYKDLAGFDFSAAEINEATVRQLHRCEFIDATENIVLIDGPGTGKTMSLRLSAFRRSSTIDGKCASSQSSNWSMCWMSLRIDPCGTLPLTGFVGGHWSDRHGYFERHSTLGTSG